MSIRVGHTFDHGIAYISEIVNSESTKLMQPINRKDRSPVVKKFSIKHVRTRDRETDHVLIRILLFFLFGSRSSGRSRSLSDRRGSNGKCFGIREIFFDLEQGFKGVGRRPKCNKLPSLHPRMSSRSRVQFPARSCTRSRESA